MLVEKNLAGKSELAYAGTHGYVVLETRCL